MIKNKLFQNISKLIFILYYVAIGIVILAFLNNKEFLENNRYLGFLIMAGSIPHLLIYFVEGGLFSKTKTSILIIGIIGFALSFVFVFSDTMTIEEICLYWGILDICRGAIEIGETLPHCKHDKLEYIEIAISIGDIVLGILLCIHLAHGLKLHLIYFAIAFFMYALKIVVAYLINYSNSKKCQKD